MHAVFEQVAKGLKPAACLLDIGPGVRPQTMVKAAMHICVEPHQEYAAVLEKQGFRVVNAAAPKALQGMGRVDTIIALDVIEHMEREDGERFLSLAKRMADQVVVFTPLGFLKQSYKNGEKDAWGMNGAHWQTHRSGWQPADFPGWNVIKYPRFHGKKGGAFFAIWG